MIYFPAIDVSDKKFESKLKAFYRTNEWKNLRDAFRSKMAQFCCVCGAEENLSVDHINPIRFFWEQRLDENNLQILCKECNFEKGYGIGWTLKWHIESKEKFRKKRKSDEYWRDEAYGIYMNSPYAKQPKKPSPKIIFKSKESKKVRIVKKDGTIIERDA